LTPAEAALVAAFGERLSQLPGDGAVMVKRDNAIEQIKAGLPTKRIESWHYTDLRRLLASVPAFDETAKAEAVAPVLDETDSGLDIDALKIVAEGVNALRSSDRAFVVITHYQRLLEYIVPDSVHVLYRGQVIKSGDKNLALELEENGYAGIIGEAA
jgi:ABC-type branched-subunit amino acid transport system ATPase component